jgi:hypothetical protein
MARRDDRASPGVGDQQKPQFPDHLVDRHVIIRA